MLDVVVTVLVVITTTGFVSFVALYATLARWWEDELGQALMGVAFMVATFLVLALVFRAAPDWDGWPYFRVVCWLLIAAASVRLPWVFLKTRAATRRREGVTNDGGRKMEFVARYKKLWYAIGAVLLAVVVALTDPLTSGVSIEGGISATEWIALASMASGAAVVAFAPDVPGAAAVKGICYLIVGLLAVLPATALTDGIDATEALMLAAFVLSSFGVTSARNVGDYYDRARQRQIGRPAPR
jgi:hypothetical protein